MKPFIQLLCVGGGGCQWLLGRLVRGGGLRGIQQIPVVLLHVDLHWCTFYYNNWYIEPQTFSCLTEAIVGLINRTLVHQLSLNLFKESLNFLIG